MKKVYLDSNVIMKLFFKEDADLRKILENSKNGKIIAYVSWLSLTEVSRSASRAEKGLELSVRMDEVFRNNNILVLSDPDRSLSSGSFWKTGTDLDYSDHLHLSIARRAKVDYFVTYDRDLLSKSQFDSITILDPHSFVERELED